MKNSVTRVAMVTVAAVALGSSTYAWFVSNSSVQATTTNISAQSNSAYLVIQNSAARTVNGKDNVTGTNVDSTSSAVASERPATTKLYPAQVIAEGKWQSAYASNASESTEKAQTRFDITSTGLTAASGEAAVKEGYAVKNTFYIGTGTYDGEFSNLKVETVTVNSKQSQLYTVSDNATDDKYAYLKGTTPKTDADYITKAQYEAVASGDASSELADAMRVLIKCGNNWVVWKNGTQVETYKTTENDNVSLSGQATNGVLADKIVKGTDQTVDVYVYYDGADTNVFSDNLADLKDCGVNITFTATPVTHGSTNA